MDVRRQRGITLIETLTALAVAAVLSAIGAPALGSLLARSHQQSAGDALQDGLMHAREMAVMRGIQIIVCPTADGVSCSDDDLWQRGWMIAADANNDRQPDATLTRFDAMPQTMRVVSSRGRPRVLFQPDGSAGGSNAQLTICSTTDAREGRAIVVSNSGRVRAAPADASHLQTCLASN